MKDLVKFIAIALETIGILSFVTIFISVLMDVAGNDILVRMVLPTVMLISGFLLITYENNIEKKNNQISQPVSNTKMNMNMNLKFFLVAITISIILLIMFFAAATQIHFSDV